MRRAEFAGHGNLAILNAVLNFFSRELGKHTLDFLTRARALIQNPNGFIDADAAFMEQTIKQTFRANLRIGQFRTFNRADQRARFIPAVIFQIARNRVFVTITTRKIRHT